MELTIYRQSTRTRASGAVVYKGEDALPYAADPLFFVADGLGGRGAIYIKTPDPGLFDRKTLPAVLFDGVLEPCEDSRFRKYLEDSFSELYAVKDCYHDDGIKNLKKSGYFGSRIVSAILLHDILTHPDRTRELFEHLSSASAQEAEELERECGSYYASLIKDRLRASARHAGLVFDSPFSNMTFLGTTLCATLFRERESAVDALYLTAGDSRPYVWTEKDGLCQLLPDEESVSGEMTNIICANDNADFHIRCNFFRFDKPCVLFNASDGCFDAQPFKLAHLEFEDKSQESVSGLAFERQLLDILSGSESIQAAGKSLQAFFEEPGCSSDDSSTIALKVFGYASYDELAQAAARRRATLEERYFSAMPELLDTNYQASVDKREKENATLLLSLKDAFAALAPIRANCIESVKSGAWPPYLEKLKNLDADEHDCDLQIQDLRGELEAIAASDFSKFLPVLGCQGGKGRIDLTEVERISERIEVLEEFHTKSLREQRRRFEASVETLRGIFEALEKGGLASLCQDETAVDFSGLSFAWQPLRDNFEFLSTLQRGELGSVKTLPVLYEKLAEANRRLANRYPDLFAEICETLSGADTDLDSVDISPERKVEVQALVGELCSLTDCRKAIRTEKADLLPSCANDYWEENFNDVIRVVLEDPDASLPQDLVTKAKELLQTASAELAPLKEKAGTQRSLLEDYGQGYRRYMEET